MVNLLQKCPVLKQKIVLNTCLEDRTLAQVLIPRTNFLERLSIRYLKQPTHHCVQLDQLGSFVLRQCTGENPVEKLENSIEERFGPTASPVRERLFAFLAIVEANGWIDWRESP